MGLQNIEKKNENAEAMVSNLQSTPQDEVLPEVLSIKKTKKIK